MRIWSEIWRFICDARGLCMGCLIFLGVFHVGCTGLLLSFFYFHLLGGGGTGNLHIVTFYLILDACFYYISPYGDGEANRGSKRMFLGFGYCFFYPLFSYAFSFRRVRFDYNAVDVRVTGVCLLQRLYFDRILGLLWTSSEKGALERYVLIYLSIPHLFGSYKGTT